MLSRLLFIVSLIAAPAYLLAQMATPPVLNTALQTAGNGDIVDLGFSSVSSTHLLNQGTAKLTDAGGALLYSDCPETVTAFGKLYSDTLPAGNDRVFLYHVNGMGAGNTMRFSAVFTNQGATTATMTLTRKSFPNPSGNYGAIGREGIRQYYENAPLSVAKEIGPGGSGLMDDALDARIVTNNQLVNAIFDVTLSHPLHVTVVAVSASANTLATFAALPQSPNDAFLRQGTYPKNAREKVTPYAYKTTDGIKRIRIADGAPINADPPMAGADAELGGAARTLSGNYAVTYRVRVDVRSDDGRRLALLLNPRAGAYGGYFRVTLPETTGIPVGNLIPSPATTVTMNTQGGVIALQTLAATSETMLIEFIPAGAMSLPFEILLVPYTTPATPTISLTATPSPTVSLSPTVSPSPTESLTPSPSATISPTETATPSPTTAPSPTASFTASLTASPTPNAQTSFTVY